MEDRQTVKGFQAPSYGVHGVSLPATHSRFNLSSTFLSGDETRSGRQRRASEFHQRSSVLNSIRRFRHSISLGGPEKAHKKQKEEEAELWLQTGVVNSQNRGGLWNWRPLRALAHLGHSRVHCAFVAHVHAITNMPACMDGLTLTVLFQLRHSSAQTFPRTVSHSCAEFDETLRMVCTVYGSKKAPNMVNYGSEWFVLSVLAMDQQNLELGKHCLDLTRLLPINSDEKGSSENELGRNLSLGLCGMAQGGRIEVTFGYEILEKRSRQARLSEDFKQASTENMHDFPLSIPVDVAMEQLNIEEGEERSLGSNQPPALSQVHDKFAPFAWLDSKIRHFSRPRSSQLGDSTVVPVSKPGQKKMGEAGVNSEDDGEFEVVDRGVEVSSLNENALTRPPYTETPGGKEGDSHASRNTAGHSLHPSIGRPVSNVRGSNEEEEKDWIIGNNSIVSSSSSSSLSSSSSSSSSSSFSSSSSSLSAAAGKMKTKGILIRNHSDVEVELVTGEFLHMLEEKHSADHSSDIEPSSHKALPPQHINKTCVQGRGKGLDFSSLHNRNFELGEDQQKFANAIGGSSRVLTSKEAKTEDNYAPSWDSKYEAGFAAIMESAEVEFWKATQKMSSKVRIKVFENAENATLMQEWGLEEKAFQSMSSINHQQGLNSRTSMTSTSSAPPLAEGFGTIIPTKDGGSLRSMSSIYFQGGKYNCRLVMHLSRPVVLPGEMGYEVVDILQGMAAAGMEQMASQAMKAMPLDDITGKSEQQIALEGRPIYESTSHRYLALNSVEKGGFDLQTAYCSEFEAASADTDIGTANTKDIGGVFEEKNKVRPRSATDSFEKLLALEQLAPAAMQRIEAIAIEGLKIQCGMAEKDAPYDIAALSSGHIEEFENEGMRNERAISFIDGALALHPPEEMRLSGEDSCRNGLMSMAIPLDEWMRLGAGFFNEFKTNKEAPAILAAHDAAWKDAVPRGEKAHDKEKKQATHWLSSRKPVPMNHTLNLAMLLQLRDPLRNYEPVGSPMMALVQAEHVLQPSQKMWKRVSVKANGEDEENNKTQGGKVSQFKIIGVHMAGLNIEMEKKKYRKKIWGDERQHQSGSRWLIAYGMAKVTTPKHPLYKPKQMPTTGKIKQSESLWSISAQLHGNGEKWPKPSALNPHKRNPNIVFTNDTIRTR